MGFDAAIIKNGRKRFTIPADPFLLLGLILFFSACYGKPSIYTDQIQYRQKLSDLLNNPEIWASFSPEERFSAYNSLLATLSKPYSKSIEYRNWAFSPQILQLDALTLFHLNTKPDDPYNSYYLYNLTQHYQQRGEETISLWLLRERYSRYPDLSVAGYPSIQYLILDLLGRREPELENRIAVILKILYRHSTEKNRGTWLYRLGSAYEAKIVNRQYGNKQEKAELLKQSMDSYQKFLESENPEVPEAIEAPTIATNKLNIYNANRMWYTDENLSRLIQKIKQAILGVNARQVLYYQANGFFVLSSDYRDNEYKWNTNIYLPNYLGGAIIFGELTPESNNNEAWLYSTNWPFYLPTWYLYFRRINFPADPKLHNRWEWAGIYLGNFY